MAFDPKPTEVIAGWSEDGTNVTFPIASVPELTAAEADAVDGDLRRVWYALLMQLHAYFSTLNTEDKPAFMNVLRFTSPPDDLTGLITRNFILEFKINGPLEVEDEP